MLWVQGCTLACPGCFNPDTHPRVAEGRVPISEVFHRIAACAPTVEGVTITGGEPLQQRRALVVLLGRVRHETTLSVVLFTGYSWIEVQHIPEVSTLLSSVDVLIAGRYDPQQRLARGLRGSANKTVHLLSNRYNTADLNAVPTTEAVIDSTGLVVHTGIDPLKH